MQNKPSTVKDERESRDRTGFLWEKNYLEPFLENSYGTVTVILLGENQRLREVKWHRQSVSNSKASAANHIAS